MFTATQYDFRSSPDVRKNFPFPTLRTEEAPTQWLLGKRKLMQNLFQRISFSNQNLFSVMLHI